MKYLLIVCCMMLSLQFCKAADNDSTEVKNNILFFKDPRVDVLQKIYSRKAAGPKKGYIRVQIFQATARDKVFEAKAQFSARYPGIPTFVSYISPNFKLRAGDFETHQEAFKFMQGLKKYFPSSFVIEEKAADDKSNGKKGN
jgi:hypothetical protein